MSKVRVDTVEEYTSANGITIDGKTWVDNIVTKEKVQLINDQYSLRH